MNLARNPIYDSDNAEELGRITQSTLAHLDEATFELNTFVLDQLQPTMPAYTLLDPLVQQLITEKWTSVNSKAREVFSIHKATWLRSQATLGDERSRLKAQEPTIAKCDTISLLRVNLDATGKNFAERSKLYDFVRLSSNELEKEKKGRVGPVYIKQLGRHFSPKFPSDAIGGAFFTSEVDVGSYCASSLLQLFTIARLSRLAAVVSESAPELKVDPNELAGTRTVT